MNRYAVLRQITGPEVFHVDYRLDGDEALVEAHDAQDAWQRYLIGRKLEFGYYFVVPVVGSRELVIEPTVTVLRVDGERI